MIVFFKSFLQKIICLSMFPSFADAFDNELVMKTLCDIIQGETVHIPVYDFVTHSRSALLSLSLHKLLLWVFWWVNHCWTYYESYVLHTSYRKDEFVTVYPADVVLFEGILMFYSQEIRDLFQMKLFVDTDPDTRLSRRGRWPDWHFTCSLI